MRTVQKNQQQRRPVHGLQERVQKLSQRTGRKGRYHSQTGRGNTLSQLTHINPQKQSQHLL